MSVPAVLFLAAFLLAAVDLIRSRGESLQGWAVVFVCIGLLWGWLGEVL